MTMRPAKILTAALAVIKLVSASPYRSTSAVDEDALLAELDFPTPQQIINQGQNILFPLIPTDGHGRKESLALSHQGELYYSAGQGAGKAPSGTAARLKLQFTVPTLILDHALESYQSVTCDGGSMSVNFHSHEYFEFVREEWAQHHEMVVITSDDGCASYSDGSHHTYFRAYGLVFDETTLGLTLRGDHMELEDIMEDALLEFGEVTHLPLQHRAIKARAQTYTTTRSSSSTPKTTSTTITTKTSPSSSVKTISTSVMTSSYMSKSSSSTPLTTIPATSKTSTVASALTTVTSPTNSTTGVVASVNSTTSTASATQCGPLTTSTLSGMPAATCGPTFDQILDDALGYYSFDDDNFADTWAVIAPGASLDPFYNPGDLTSPPLNKRKIKFTGHFTLAAAVKSLAKSVVSRVQNAVSSAAKIVASLPGKIVSAAKSIAKFVVALIEGHPSVSLTVPMSWTWGGRESSPWGPSKLIHVWKGREKVAASKKPVNLLPGDYDDISHIAVYCVKCGFNGRFKTTGSIGFNRNGIYSATLDQNGDLDLNLGIGIDALAVKIFELGKKTLYTTPLPGLGIPKILALGPILVVQAGASLETKAMGQLLFQGNVSFRNAQTHTDYLDRSKSFSKNWKPTVGGGIDVHGAVSAGIVFELPIGVAFGLDVLNGKFSKKAVSIVDTTSLEIEAKLQFAASASGTSNSSSGTSSGTSDASFNKDLCRGVAWNVSLHNKLSIDVIEKKNTFKLFEVELPVAGGCVSMERNTPTGPSNPSASPQKTAPDSCTPVSGNLLQNGNFDSNSLAPWYLNAASPQDTFDVSSGAIAAHQTRYSDYSNPYSSMWFRQDGLRFCPGQTYTFSFDYMFDQNQGDVYIYGTLYYTDGTANQGIFGTRDLSDYDAIGTWKHYTGVFSATGTLATFEIGAVACNYEQDITFYDNFSIVAGGTLSTRAIETRQEDNNVQLDQTVGGVNEDDANTPNPDNLDYYNADGSVRAPPDDSDLDLLVQQFLANQTARDDAEDKGAALQSYIDTYPPVGPSGNNSNYSPPLPDEDGNIYQTLPLNDRSGQLSAGTDGNIYFEPVDLGSPSGLWMANSGVWGSDFSGRFLHVYTPEINNLNASRIRLGDQYSFPRTALVVGLAGVKVGSSNLVVALDTNGAIYYLVACNYVDTSLGSKLFVVSDQGTGLANLVSPLGSWTVTGGIVSNCALIGVNPPTIIASISP